MALKAYDRDEARDEKRRLEIEIELEGNNHFEGWKTPEPSNKGIFMTTYAVLGPKYGTECHSMDEYQKAAVETATYPELGENLVYPALGLSGEAGEVSEKVKKLWRNKGIKSAKGLDKETKDAILKEVGDCLWYIAALCEELGTTMSSAAQMNIEKLRDRRARGVIKSEGDNR